MNIREAVEYLKARDYRCSASTVRKLARAGKLRCYRPGLSGRGRMEFAPDRLDAFLRAAEFGTEAPMPTPEPPPKIRAPRVKPAPKVEAAGEGWEQRLAKAIES